MKTWRTRLGPFAERPVYSLQEIESICADELKKVNLYPNEPEPIRIERFYGRTGSIGPRKQKEVKST